MAGTLRDAERLQQVAKWLGEAERAVAFTGAGISTESGLSDFRSPGGVWSKHQPVMYQDFMSSREARLEAWRQKAELFGEFVGAVPNRGHEILARWEQTGRIRGVITQNIDGLHQRSGSRQVLELHGTALEAECQDCGRREPIVPVMRQFQETGQLPQCAGCRSDRVKTATISFGQALAPEVLRQSMQWAEEADLFLALGSSLVVEPAASLPRMASRAGARLVIVNRDETPLDRLADARFGHGIGDILTAIDALLVEANG